MQRLIRASYFHHIWFDKDFDKDNANGSHPLIIDQMGFWFVDFSVKIQKRMPTTSKFLQT